MMAVVACSSCNTKQQHGAAAKSSKRISSSNSSTQYSYLYVIAPVAQITVANLEVSALLKS